MSLHVSLATAAYTALAGVLVFIVARAAVQTRSERVAWLGMGFVLMFTKGIVLSIGLFMRPAWEELIVPALLIDIGVLATFYVAVLRR